MSAPNNMSNDLILEILKRAKVPFSTSLVKLAATVVARSKIANNIIPGARKSNCEKDSVPETDSTSPSNNLRGSTEDPDAWL